MKSLIIVLFLAATSFANTSYADCSGSLDSCSGSLAVANCSGALASCSGSRMLRTPIRSAVSRSMERAAMRVALRPRVRLVTESVACGGSIARLAVVRPVAVVPSEPMNCPSGIYTIDQGTMLFRPRIW